MFCRSKAEIEAEEAAKALAAKSKTTSTKVERSVLDAKIINDLAMTIMSLRIPAVEIYQILSSLDEFTLSYEQI